MWSWRSGKLEGRENLGDERVEIMIRICSMNEPAETVETERMDGLK